MSFQCFLGVGSPILKPNPVVAIPGIDVLTFLIRVFAVSVFEGTREIVGCEIVPHAE